MHRLKILLFCALDVRDGMCDWALRHSCGHPGIVDILKRSNSTFSKKVDWPIGYMKDAVNGNRTVHGRNQVSGWEDFRIFFNVFQRSAQKIIFHERSWDVGQERCSETGP